MQRKLKARKCRLRTCRREFQPTTEWQKFCSVPCRSIVANRERAKLVRTAMKALQAQEKGAA